MDKFQYADLLSDVRRWTHLVRHDPRYQRIRDSLTASSLEPDAVVVVPERPAQGLDYPVFAISTSGGCYRLTGEGSGQLLSADDPFITLQARRNPHFAAALSLASK